MPPILAVRSRSRRDRGNGTLHRHAAAPAPDRSGAGSTGSSSRPPGRRACAARPESARTPSADSHVRGGSPAPAAERRAAADPSRCDPTAVAAAASRSDAAPPSGAEAPRFPPPTKRPTNPPTKSRSSRSHDQVDKEEQHRADPMDQPVARACGSCPANTRASHRFTLE